eukprot:XP_020397624.1 extensin-like [Zea mays]
MVIAFKSSISCLAPVSPTAQYSAYLPQIATRLGFLLPPTHSRHPPLTRPQPYPSPSTSHRPSGGSSFPPGVASLLPVAAAEPLAAKTTVAKSTDKDRKKAALVSLSSRPADHAALLSKRRRAGVPDHASSGARARAPPPVVAPGTMADADACEPGLCLSSSASRARARAQPPQSWDPHAAALGLCPPRDCCLPPHRRYPTGSGTGGPSPACAAVSGTAAAAAVLTCLRPSSALQRRSAPPPRQAELFPATSPSPLLLSTPDGPSSASTPPHAQRPPAFLRAAATRSAPQPSYASCAPLPPTRSAPGLPVRPARAVLLIALPAN